MTTTATTSTPTTTDRVTLFREEVKRFISFHKDGSFSNLPMTTSSTSLMFDDSMIMTAATFNNSFISTNSAGSNGGSGGTGHLNSPLSPILNNNNHNNNSNSLYSFDGSSIFNSTTSNSIGGGFPSSHILDSLSFTSGERLWILHVIERLFKNLIDVVEGKDDVYKVIENLLVFLFNNPVNTTDNSNSSNEQPSKRMKIDDQYQQQQQPKNRLPITTRILSIIDLLKRDLNLTSKSSVKNDHKLLRILIGKVTSIQTNSVNQSHVLTLLDGTGQIIIELGSNSDIYVYESIVLIPYFNLICTNSTTSSLFSLSMSSVSRFSMIDGMEPKRVDLSKLNYLEVEHIQVLYRPQSHYYEKLLDLFHMAVEDKKQQQIEQQEPITELDPADTHFLFEEFIFELFKPYSTIAQLKAANEPIQSLNTHGQVVSKSAIIHTKPSSNPNHKTVFFFLQIKKIKPNTGLPPSISDVQEPDIFIIFFEENLKWFDLIHVGDSLLFVDVGCCKSNLKSEKKNILVMTPKSCLFSLNNLKLHIDLKYHSSSSSSFISNSSSNSSNQQQQKKNRIVDYDCTITEELNPQGIVGINAAKLFLSHYRSNLFHARGLRVGNKIRLENVHEIKINNELVGLGMCPSSSIRFLKFDDKHLQNYVPFSKWSLEKDHACTEIWKKYTITDSYILTKLLKKLLKKFSDVFENMDSFKSIFQHKPLYEYISNLFNIHKMEENEQASYDCILAHDKKCVFSESNHSNIPSLLKLTRLQSLKSDRISIKFNNTNAYSLIGKIQLVPQNFEWGKISLVDSNAIVDCFITGISEHHLNKIWKINRFQLNFEEYQENNEIKSSNYLQFSIDDCELLSPIIDKSTKAYTNLPYQSLFDDFQSLSSMSESSKPISNVSNLFILLLEKTVHLGLIELKAILLTPLLPMVVIKTNSSLSINFPILQEGQCYFVTGATLKSSEFSMEPSNRLVNYEFNLSTNSILKSIAYVNQETKKDIYPKNITARMIKDLSIPVVWVKPSFISILMKLESKVFNIKFQNIKEISEYKYINNDDYVSFRGLIISKKIEILKSGTILLHLVCTDPDDPGRHKISVIIKNFYCGLLIGSVIDFYFLQVRSSETQLDSGIPPKILSNRFFYYKLTNAYEDIDLNLFDFIDTCTLSEINKNSFDQYFHSIVDVVSLLKFELSFKCKECNVGSLRKCFCPGGLDRFIFNGKLECEISDGTSVKNLVVKRESIILEILNFSIETYLKIKEHCIATKQTFAWEQPLQNNSTIGKGKPIILDLSSKSLSNNEEEEEEEEEQQASQSENLEKSIPLRNFNKWRDFINAIPELNNNFKQLLQNRTFSVIVKKLDIFGKQLLCNNLKLTNTPEESWKIVKQQQTNK